MSSPKHSWRLSRSRSLEDNNKLDIPTLPILSNVAVLSEPGESEGFCDFHSEDFPQLPSLTSSTIMPRHDLSTSTGKDKSMQFISYLIEKERRVYRIEASLVAHPLHDTFLATRLFFLKFAKSSHYLSGKTIYAAQFIFENFYANNVAGPSQDEIEISKRCCLAVAVKLNELHNRRNDSLLSSTYEMLYATENIQVDRPQVRKIEGEIMTRMMDKVNAPTPFDYLPRLVVEHFLEASEYEKKYKEVSSLLLDQMNREDFDVPITNSKPSAMALAAITIIAAYPDPPMFSTDNVLQVEKTDFQRYVAMMQRKL